MSGRIARRATLERWGGDSDMARFERAVDELRREYQWLLRHCRPGPRVHLTIEIEDEET